MLARACMKGSCLLSGVLLFAAPWAILRAAPDALTAKTSFERTLEAKLEELLAAMLGPGRAQVFAEAQVDLSYTEETGPRGKVDGPRGASAGGESAFLWGRLEERLRGSPKILPGFRAPSHPSAEPGEFRRKILFPKDPVQKLRLRIVLDTGVSKAQVKAVLATLEEVLSLDLARGDEVAVLQRPLKSTQSSGPSFDRLPGLLAALLGLALLAGVVSLMRGSRAYGRIPGSQSRGFWRGRAPLGIFGALPAAQALHPPQADGAPAPPTAAQKPLDLRFLKSGHLRFLARFLSEETPQAARLVLASLRTKEEAARVFSKLSLAMQQAVAEAFTQPTPEDPRLVRELEDSLKAFVEHEERGPAFLEEILIRTPSDMREDVIRHLKLSSPATASRLEAELPVFGEIAEADLNALQRVLAPLTTVELAAALYDTSREFTEKILTALPEVARQALTRKLETFVPFAPSEVEQARIKILQRFRE